MEHERGEFTIEEVHHMLCFAFKRLAKAVPQKRADSNLLARRGFTF
jgi:hypothetical protein